MHECTLFSHQKDICFHLWKTLYNNHKICKYVYVPSSMFWKSTTGEIQGLLEPHCKWRAGENPVLMSGSDLCILWNLTVQPRHFNNRITIFCLPISTFMYLWAIYILQQSVCCGPIIGIYKSLTDTWAWKLGTRPHSFISGNISFKFSVQCMTPTAL